MKKDFLFAQVEPKIIQALPETKEIIVNSKTFQKFPQIKEFGSIQLHDIKLKSLDLHYNEGIEICYIHKGKYQWQIEGKEYLLLPGDCFITYPWQKHGSPKGILDIGQITWIIIRPKTFLSTGQLNLGSWSNFSKKEQNEIGLKLVKSKRQHFSNQTIKFILDTLHFELRENDFGQSIKINFLLDNLFIEVIRSLSEFNKKEINHVDQGRTKIERLKQKLKNEMAYNWSLNEMAEIAGVGQTTLNLLIKRETGFSPGQFLINLRIETAKDLLLNSNENLTKIAFDCGFCSSQHFSASFKQKTGYSPKAFRNKK